MRKFFKIIYKFGPLAMTLVIVSVFGFLVSANPKVNAQGSSGSFSFGVAGDYSSTSNTDAVLTAVKNSGVNFQLAVGDLSYDTQGSPAGWGAYVKKIVGTVPFPFVMGNHDASKVDQFVAALPNPMTNAQGEYGKQYYFDYPQTAPLARFILISPVDGKKDTNWLNTAIDSGRRANIKWIIVGMHQPCLAVGQKSCESGQDLLTDLITQKVDVVLYGHDHNYQRTKQLTCATANAFKSSCAAVSGPTFKKGLGTIFATVGTGGNSFYTVSKTDTEAGYFDVMNNDTFGFLKFTVTPAKISAEFVKAGGGSLADTFTIEGDAGAAPPAISGMPSGAPVGPTFYPLAPCPSCGSPTVVQGSAGPSVPAANTSPTMPSVPTVMASNPAPNSPCPTGDSDFGGRAHKKHAGGVSGLMEVLLKFIIELLNLLMKSSGGGSQMPVPSKGELPCDRS